MALQKQVVELDFSKGLDQGTAKELLPNGAFVELRNCYQNKSGSIEKRNGNVALARSVIGEGIATNYVHHPVRLGDRAGELFAVDARGRYLYAYSEAADEWREVGPAPSCTVQRETLGRNGVYRSSYDCAVIGDYACFSWLDTNLDTGVVQAVVRIVDRDTRQNIVHDLAIDVSSHAPGYRAPKIVTHDGFFRILYSNDAHGISTRRFSFDILAWTQPVELIYHAIIHATNHSFDCYAAGDLLFLAYFTDAGNKINVYSYDTAGCNNPPSAQSGKTIVASVGHTIAVAADSQECYVAWDDASGNIMAWHGLAINLSEHVSAYQLSTPHPFTLCHNITILPIPAAVDAYTLAQGAWFAWDGIEPNEPHCYQAVAWCARSLNGTSIAAQRKVHNAALVSRLWLLNYLEPHVIVKYEITEQTMPACLQKSYFALSLWARTCPPVGRHVVTATIAPRQGEFEHQTNSLTTCAPLDSASTKSLPVLGVGSLPDANQYPSGIDLVTLDYRDDQYYSLPCCARGQVILSGGVPSIYDGRTVSEIGFLLYPEIVNKTASVTGGALADGTFQVTFVYEWTDANGFTHQSAPAPPASITLVGGGAQQSVSVEVTCLQMTNRSDYYDHEPPIQIVPYRTTIGGTVFYREHLKNVLLPLGCYQTYARAANVSTVDILVGTIADTSIVSHPLLYTTGGSVDNVCPPSCVQAYEHAGSIVLVGCEDPYVVWMSKSLVAEEAPAFNEAITFRIDGSGPLTGGAPLGEAKLFFTASETWVVYGQGPNDTLTQNDLTPPKLVSRAAGCINARSIVVGPNSVFFQGTRGIYAIDAGLQPVLISDAIVDTLALYPVVRAACIIDQPGTTHVRFALNNAAGTAGVVAVYDYSTAQWSIYDFPYTAAGVTTLQPVWAMCQSGGLWHTWIYDTALAGKAGVYRESLTTWLDNTSFIPMSFTTGPIRVAGLQGFGRVWRVSLLGSVLAPVAITLSDYQDYLTTATSTWTWADYDIAAVTGTPRLQLQAHVSRQRCESIALHFQDSRSTASLLASSQRGISLSGISIEYGARPGLARTNPTERR